MMLDDYFSIKISRRETDDGIDYHLEALPMLIEEIEPDLVDLPMLIIRLVSVVDWNEEKECFDSICRELARFYAIKNTEHEIDAGKSSQEVVAAAAAATARNTRAGDEKKPKDKWKIEHILYRAFKSALLPPKPDGQHFKFKLVDLAALYKVFERC